MMARRGHAYPQATPTAADLIDGALVTAPPTLTATDGLRLARHRHAEALAVGARGWVLRDDLVRATALGVGSLAIAELARRLPVAAPRESEVRVRRHLTSGAPAVVVGEGRSTLGVVRRAPPPVALFMQGRFERWLDTGSREVLATAGRLAAAHGARAFVVGGLVRDALLERPPARYDLDVVVEGDALAVARALADAASGTLVEHERFLTASVTLADRRRVDLVTARSERYERPGALPHVLPALIAQDLKRRDFTVNTLAVELASGGFGLLDPLGGGTDVARRRLRILHPLSFVEDPTRIFRAARYAARLGFALDAWSARCQALALSLAPYPALSPARIVAELERILADAEPAAALTLLARAGAFRLLDPRYRTTRAGLARLQAVPPTLAWIRARGVPAPAVELLTVALAADQPAEVVAAALRGLGLSGAPLERVRQTLAGAAALATGLRAARPSEAARALRAASPTALAWRHLTADVAASERLDRLAAAVQAQRPALGGGDAIALGVPPGPDVAAVLAALRDGRLEGEIGDRQGEIDYVKAWVRNRKKEG
jgi:tRNA nucleotidyltransferase (CCA-adding enzyme)